MANQPEQFVIPHLYGSTSAKLLPSVEFKLHGINVVINVNDCIKYYDEKTKQNEIIKITGFVFKHPYPYHFLAPTFYFKKWAPSSKNVPEPENDWHIPMKTLNFESPSLISNFCWNKSEVVQNPEILLTSEKTKISVQSLTQKQIMHILNTLIKAIILNEKSLAGVSFFNRFRRATPQKVALKQWSLDIVNPQFWKIGICQEKEDKQFYFYNERFKCILLPYYDNLFQSFDTFTPYRLEKYGYFYCHFTEELENYSNPLHNERESLLLEREPSLNRPTKIVEGGSEASHESTHIKVVDGKLFLNDKDLNLSEFTFYDYIEINDLDKLNEIWHNEKLHWTTKAKFAPNTTYSNVAFNTTTKVAEATVKGIQFVYRVPFYLHPFMLFWVGFESVKGTTMYTRGFKKLFGIDEWHRR